MFSTPKLNRYIGAAILSILSCVVYSYSWMSGSASCIIGIITWAAVVVNRYSGIYDAVHIIIGISDFAVLLWARNSSTGRSF